MRIQVLGLCRFSLLVAGGFRMMPEALADRRKVLYEPARLNLRMIWFEHVFLPGLKAQTDPDFTMIVATGEDLPDPWRSRLMSLCKTVPQITLMFLPPAGHNDGPREALLAHVDPEAYAVAQFRLDDDDAVAVDFISRLRMDFQARMQPLFEMGHSLMVDHARGFALTGFEGRVSLYPLTTQSWALAQAIYLRPDHPKTVMDYPHKHIFRHMTSVSMVDRVMYVRGVHDWNDSGIRDHKLPSPLAPDRARQWIHNRFRIDLDGLAAALHADVT